MNFCTWANIFIIVFKDKDMSPYYKTFREGFGMLKLHSEVQFVAFDYGYNGKRNAEHFQDFHICTKVNQKYFLERDLN